MTPFGIRKRIKQKVGAVVEAVTALFGGDEPAQATPAAAARDRLKSDPVRRAAAAVAAPAVYASEADPVAPVKERVGRKAVAKAAAKKPAARKPAAKKPVTKAEPAASED